jgi:hypothetical protein
MSKSSYSDQLENLIVGFGLTPADVPVVRHLPSFHDISHTIRQRLDTKQYLSIFAGESYQDDKDDYFEWEYISEVKCQKLLLEDERIMEKANQCTSIGEGLVDVYKRELVRYP